MANPNHNDWDRFWRGAGSGKPGKVSWSKKRIVDILEPLVGAGKKALDAGCGSGFFSGYFCQRGMKTVSLDYSQHALDMTDRLTQGRSRIIKQDLTSASVIGDIGESFDIIFSDGLLEHFLPDEQDKIVGNLKKLLLPDGVLVTFVPNRWSPWELIRPLFMPGIEEKPFVLKELVDVNHRNGLRVFKKGGINTFPFVFSPDRILGPALGMLLYTLSKK